MTIIANKKIKRVLILASIFLILAVIVYAATSYDIGNGASTSINEHGTCKSVTNNCGPTIFIPTNTQSEWDTFRSNAPGCTSQADCCNSCWVTTEWYWDMNGASGYDEYNNWDCNEFQSSYGANVPVRPTFTSQWARDTFAGKCENAACVFDGEDAGGLYHDFSLMCWPGTTGTYSDNAVYYSNNCAMCGP